MSRLTLALLLLLVPALSLAAPSSQERRVHPRELSGLPSYVKRVEPSIVGLRVRAPENAPSSARLGSRRFGSAVIFDARGYAVTVSYLLLDAASLEARSRGGRWEALLVALDLDAGLGVIKLEGAGPWAAAPLGKSADVVTGARTGTVG